MSLGRRVAVCGVLSLLIPTGVRAEPLLQMDMIGRANPPGLAAFATVSWGRPAGAGAQGPYRSAAMRAGATPAYSQAGAFGDWVPMPWLQLRAFYDLLAYHGANDGVLSFPSHDAPFGSPARDALDGREQSVLAHRVMLQPALRLRHGRWSFVNQFDAARYWLGGSGPYLLELEYDTLLRKRDVLLADRTLALYALSEDLAAGPFFELTRSLGAGLKRHRVGLNLRWTPRRAWGLVSEPRVTLQLGLHTTDPNRRGQAFVVAVLGARVGN